MTDPAPVNPPASPVPVSNAPVVLRIIAAIVLGLPGIAGLLVFGGTAGYWLSDGMQFTGSDIWLMTIFIIGAEILISFSVLIVGIILRFARWQRAPVASLVLAVTSALVFVLGYQMLLDSYGTYSDEDQQLTLMFAAIGLVVVSGPPFLHWWTAKRKEA